MKKKLLRQIIMLSKLAIYGIYIQCLFMGVLMASDSGAQSIKSVREVKIHVDSGIYPLGRIFKKIESSTNFYFSYYPGDIDLTQKVSINGNDQWVSEILLQISKATDLSFRQINNSINVRKKSNNASQKSIEVIINGITITGKVISENDQSGLPGVNVIIKGTTIGTVTDVDGNYQIEVPDNNAVLVFSSVGYVSQEVVVGTRSVIDITMVPDIKSLEEIVVVGYSTQKKITLTGSVDVVKGEELQNRPKANLSQLLQGTSPALNISVTKLGGEPDAGSSWNIRGIGTLSGSSSPLVLVDGVAMDINSVNPNTIESISVLKDAAASAIYGSRAPFGVVLITTKKGSKDNKFSLSYNNFFGFASPIRVPHFESSLNLVTAFNQVYANDGLPPKFPDEQIDRIKAYMNGRYLPEYDTLHPYSSMWGGRHNGNANYDWNQMYWKQNSFRQKHDLSLSGGNRKTQYYLNSEYYDQDGLFNYTNDRSYRYSILANVNSQVNNWIKVNFNSRFAQTSYDRPVGPFGWDDGRFFMLQAMQTFWPTMPMYNWGFDKSDHFHAIGNPIVRLLESSGRHKVTNQDSWITAGIELEPIKGWKTKVSYSYNYFDSRKEALFKPVLVYIPDGSVNNIGSSTSNYETYSVIGNYKLVNAITSYNRNINDHYFNILLGYESESYFDSNLSGSVKNLITPYVPAINTGTGDKILSESKGNWGTQAFFGRFQYNYKEKYLFEVNGRYNGSSRFAPEHRWGFFPSFSVGYNISKEGFWAPISKIVNNFKLRASYGSLGNQNVPNYLYLSTVPTGVNLNWIIGDVRPMWASVPAMVSGTLTWETVTTLNLGVDMAFLNNRLEVNFDWFHRITDDMFGPAESLPAVLGAQPPQKNNAKMETTGWESTISWKDMIGSLSYNLKLIVGDATSTVLEFKNDAGLIDDFYPGKKLGEIWGYTTDGFIQSEGEAMPDQSVFYDTWGPGDIKYKDLDGDNKITYGNRTLDNHGDLSIIGNTTPRYSIGFSGGLAWKGIDFNMFWQGIGKHEFFPEYTWAASNFWGFAGGTNNSTVFKEGHLDYWRPANETNILGPNTDAYYPKPYFSPENEKSRQIQTKYMLNAAYLRLKNIQVGYTIPSEITQKIHIQKFRLYVSAENLLTFTKLTKLLDPETAFATRGYKGNRGIGRVYPLSRVLSIGMNLTF